MFATLKKKLEKRALESIRSKVSASRIRRFTPLNQVKSVVLLYRVDGATISTDLYNFIGQFERRGAAVDVVLVSKRTDAQEKLDDKDSFYYIGHQDIKWYGVPKSDKILEVLQKNHDYFIDLTMMERGICTYLANASMARFKIGGINYPSSPYDLIIDVSSDVDLGFFEEQMMVYLQKIG